MEVGKQHKPNGLSEPDVTVLRETRGHNEMEERKRNKCLEFLKHFWGPMPIMIWLAILIEAIQFDWMDFAVRVGWYEESKSSNAIKALRKNLAPECKVKRNGERLNKAPMDCCVKSGEVELGVRVTGKNTELVKIILTIANTNDVGHFVEIIIYSITLFLAAVSLILVCFIMAVLLYNIYGVLKMLGVCVVFLVASIPIAMQVVCTSTMVLSCFGREKPLFSPLAPIEELAGMDMLCSDNTGTLTQNIMTVESKLLWCETSEQGLLSVALLASGWTQNAKDVIDTILFKSKQEVQADLDCHTLLLAFRSRCRDDRIHCCGLLSQSCGDQGGCGCASGVAC